MKFIYYPNCSTCKKALKFIKERDIQCEEIDIVKQTPSQDEMKQYIINYDKGIKPFFNTSGKLYREMGLKDKVKDMDLEEASKLLSSNGMLIKRPLLVKDDKVLVGFKEQEYDEFLKDIL